MGRMGRGEMGRRGSYSGVVSLLSVLITSCTFFVSMSELFSSLCWLNHSCRAGIRRSFVFRLCYLCSVPDGLGWVITITIYIYMEGVVTSIGFITLFCTLVWRQQIWFLLTTSKTISITSFLFFVPALFCSARILWLASRFISLFKIF